MRYTTFRFALAPTPRQAAMLARHAGASRFAYNQCLRLVLAALEAKRANPQIQVPWSGYDLINGFNAWKHSAAAGRIFVVASDGTVTERATGLAWRQWVPAQVFAEAAVDLGRALAAYRDTRTGVPRALEPGSRGASAKGGAEIVSGSATSAVVAVRWQSGLVRTTLAV